MNGEYNTKPTEFIRIHLVRTVGEKTQTATVATPIWHAIAGPMPVTTYRRYKPHADWNKMGYTYNGEYFSGH